MDKKVENQTQLHKKQVHLFYCSECEDLARKVAAHSDLITLQSINWRFLYFCFVDFSGLVLFFCFSAMNVTWVILVFSFTKLRIK